MPDHPWSKASGVQGTTGKAEEEVVVVPTDDDAWTGSPRTRAAKRAGSWGVAYAAGRALGVAQPARDDQVRPKLLELSEVTVRGGEKIIVDRVTTSAGAGTVLGLIGPNGAGKSTLLRTIGGIAPDSGSVLIDGQSVRGQRARELARTVALVPQSTHVELGFTVRDVVLMGRHPHLGRFGTEGPNDLAVVAEALERTGTGHLADRVITTLSGGERQLTLIAKALAQQPRILVLDEPVSALDLRHQLSVMELIRAAADQGCLVLIAIHDLGLAARYCDRLLLLDNGRLLGDGAPEEVLRPELIRTAFGVEATIGHHPELNTITVTALQVATTHAKT